MTRSTRIVGAVPVVVVGPPTVGGVGANFALVKRAGTHATCIDRGMTTSGPRLMDAREGTSVHPAFSLVPAGLRCRFDRADGGIATNFVDLGTLPRVVGGGLALAGIATLVDNSRRERSAAV